jgi:putative redox protein
MTHGTATIGTTGYATDIVVGGHHRLIADEPVAGGGTDAGPAPYDLLVASLGACTAITLRMYADRKGWKIYSLTVDLRIVRGNDGMRIERALTIDGLGDDQKARLAEIAEKTPVTLTLKGGIPIHTTLA